MPDMNVFAIVVAAMVVLVLGSTYYVVFAAKWAQLSDAGAREDTQAGKLAVELLRGLILAAVVAGLVSQGRSAAPAADCCSERPSGSDSRSCFGPAR
jgi:hypothetical protein